MVFGSDDAALRAAAEPHISRMVESNSFRTIFISMFLTLFTTDFLPGRYASFSRRCVRIVLTSGQAKREALLL
jgi:hypothetical protein